MKGTKMNTKFFQTKAYFESRYDAVGRSLGFKATTVDEWQMWKHELLGVLHRLLGLDRMVPCPLNPRITEEIQCQDYRRQRVEIDCEPGVTMPLYVLIPDGAAGPLSPVIAAHGHLSGGKISTAGVTEIPGVAEAVATYNYDYGVKCAQRGYLVFCPDARGMGERRESLYEGPESLFGRSCDQLAKMAIPLGLTVAGMWVWDLMRLLDYVQTRPECQGKAMGCIGLSGGGFQTLFLTALDERVACAVVSGFFYGVRDAHLDFPNCDCNYIPHLWEYIDMGDVACLISPRPLLIESGTQDELNGARGIVNAIEQVEIARQAYALLGAGDHLYHDIFDAGHRWHGVQAYPWLDRWLRSDPNRA
jgi:dienelactone hydrolase